MKAQKKAAPQLVLGMFRPSTVIGQLANTLKDQKPHKFTTVLKSMKGKVSNPKYRVQILREYGKKRRAYKIEIDRKKDLIRMSGLRRVTKKAPARKAPVQQQQPAAA